MDAERHKVGLPLVIALLVSMSLPVRSIEAAHLPSGVSVRARIDPAVVAPGAQCQLAVTIELPDGWITYDVEQISNTAKPTRIDIRPSTQVAPLETFSSSAVLERPDPTFNRRVVRYFESSPTFRRPLLVSASATAGANQVYGRIDFQVHNRKTGRFYTIRQCRFEAPFSVANDAIPEPSLQAIALNGDEDAGQRESYRTRHPRVDIHGVGTLAAIAISSEESEDPAMIGVPKPTPPNREPTQAPLEIPIEVLAVPELTPGDLPALVEALATTAQTLAEATVPEIQAAELLVANATSGGSALRVPISETPSVKGFEPADEQRAPASHGDVAAPPAPVVGIVTLDLDKLAEGFLPDPQADAQYWLGPTRQDREKRSPVTMAVVVATIGALSFWTLRRLGTG